MSGFKVKLQSVEGRFFFPFFHFEMFTVWFQSPQREQQPANALS